MIYYSDHSSVIAAGLCQVIGRENLGKNCIRAVSVTVDVYTCDSVPDVYSSGRVKDTGFPLNQDNERDTQGPLGGLTMRRGFSKCETRQWK